MKQQRVWIWAACLAAASVFGCTGPDLQEEGGGVDVPTSFPTQDTGPSADSPCVPQTCVSLGAVCGAPDDGCGGALICGDCQAPLACGVDFRCECNPLCVGEICGEKDGCGGTCEQGSGCCVTDCVTEGEAQCVDGGVQTCESHIGNPCLNWSASVPCDSGTCVDGACCAPVCDGKECGDDGCGGSCGECPAAAPNCDDGGLCQAECTPSCVDKECGDDGCGGDCGSCPAAAPNCDAAGLCQAVCSPDCDDKECGDDGCGGSCGACPAAAPLCSAAGLCESDCVPDCAGKECGDDSCGDVCGTCPAAEPDCNDFGQCVDTCIPDCLDVKCGDLDGCGGTCESGSGCCNNACAMGETACQNGDWVITCGNYDPDPCTEWSGVQPCPGTGSCVNGSCEEEPSGECVYPMAPVEIITGLAATGSGTCNGDKILLDDGQASELWSNGDGKNDWLAVPVTSCQVVDFGQVCTPSEICVEAWAGQGGCSGDTCGGACENCMVVSKTSLEVFAYESNSTLNYEYKFSMQVHATGNPGDVMCYNPGDDPIRYVMVCRSGCVNPASSYNAFVDYVYLK